jgi:hypothetical protein
MLAAPIIALMLRLPHCASEPPDPARITMIAEAIADVSSTASAAAALITIGMHESGFCAAVHAGRRKGGAGEGLWQLEPGSRRQKPYSGTDLQSTRHAASEALWLWHHSYNCGAWPAARFRVYGGCPCGKAWAGAARRARFYGWVLWSLSSSGSSEGA